MKHPSGGAAAEVAALALPTHGDTQSEDAAGSGAINVQPQTNFGAVHGHCEQQEVTKSSVKLVTASRPL